MGDTHTSGITRRGFLATGPLALGAAAGAQAAASERTDQRPNVILIMTDDMGHGDLACHGNPYIRTPNLDRLHGESTRFNRFYVSPVCAPTRASLMTGRYNYRTGAVDTFMGRAMMFPDEQTVAEVLRAEGYATGLFGKWHLGDTYPMRPIDKGFDEVLCHMGGGLTQPADPPGNSYFDPILNHNGAFKPYKGYCTDIFTDAALDFINGHQSDPFFLYLATNAPHNPLEIGGRYYHPYAQMGLDETTARVYGMIENIDENVGRVLETVESAGLANDTIIIFMTDNGAQGTRFNAGLRATKGTVYEGGIRVPCFMRWPGRLEAGRTIDSIAAHIDILPTLRELCGVQTDPAKPLDGVSLAPVLLDNGAAVPDRKLFFQWHRGDVPQRYQSCAVVTQRFKLVNGTELYDLQADPEESKDLAIAQQAEVQALRSAYEAWFDEMARERNFALPNIELGAAENPVTLTRQDWRGGNKWDDTELGNRWDVHVAQAGTYTITVRFGRYRQPHAAHLTVLGQELQQPITGDTGHSVFENIRIDEGTGTIAAWISASDRDYAALYVDVERTTA